MWLWIICCNVLILSCGLLIFLLVELIVYIYLCINILWDVIYVGIVFVLKNLYCFFYFLNILIVYFILGW